MHPFFVRVFATSESGAAQALPVSFEAALTEFESLPRMYAEPDGSFIWTSPADATPHWQVEGNLVDGGQMLFYCELKGTCPADTLDQLLRCLSGGVTRLVFEVVERGDVLGEEEFRRAITSPPNEPGPAPGRPA
jgi:hypothetical protein